MRPFSKPLKLKASKISIKGDNRMSGHLIGKIDFEHWATLASSDPQKFEELRKNKISDVINEASGQRQKRLLGLQWQIDAVRDQHKESSVAACLAISELMWETFQQLADVLQSQAESGLTAPIPEVQANIIAFPEKPNT